MSKVRILSNRWDARYNQLVPNTPVNVNGGKTILKFSDRSDALRYSTENVLRLLQSYSSIANIQYRVVPSPTAYLSY